MPMRRQEVGGRYLRGRIGQQVMAREPANAPQPIGGETRTCGRLAQGPLDQLDAELAARTGTEAVSLFLEWLWKTLDGPLFAVGLELLTAARTEPELQAVLRTGGDELAAKLDETARVLAKSAGGGNRAALEIMLLMSIPMVRGIGLDLAVGGKRAEHAARFRDWGTAVLAATA